jgi:hypothetical protein
MAMAHEIRFLRGMDEDARMQQIKAFAEGRHTPDVDDVLYQVIRDTTGTSRYFSKANKEQILKWLEKDLRATRYAKWLALNLDMETKELDHLISKGNKRLPEDLQQRVQRAIDQKKDYQEWIEVLKAFEARPVEQEMAVKVGLERLGIRDVPSKIASYLGGRRKTKRRKTRKTRRNVRR